MNIEKQRRLLQELEEYTIITRELFYNNPIFGSEQPTDYEISRIALREQYQRYDKKDLSWLFDFIEIKPYDKILSIACGLGIREIVLAERGCNVTGLDMNAVSLRSANAWAQENKLNMCFVNGDAAELPFKSESFNIVLTFAFLEHMNDLKRCHEEILRVLKPGGIYCSRCINYFDILSPRLKQGRDRDMTNSITRRIKILPVVIKRFYQGYHGHYTQKIPFDQFRYGIDHKFVDGISHHLDSGDLHAINPWEMRRILRLLGFEEVKACSFYGHRSLVERMLTFLGSRLLFLLFGPLTIIRGSKPLK